MLFINIQEKIQVTHTPFKIKFIYNVMFIYTRKNTDNMQKIQTIYKTYIFTSYYTTGL